MLYLMGDSARYKNGRCFSLVEVDGVSGQNRHWAPFRNGIKFRNYMGDYKGRVNLRQRKSRFAKNRRIKALVATKKGTTPPPGAAGERGA